MLVTISSVPPSLRFSSPQDAEYFRSLSRKHESKSSHTPDKPASQHSDARHRVQKSAEHPKADPPSESIEEFENTHIAKLDSSRLLLLSSSPRIGMVANQAFR